jgi:hypothetical protein
MAIDTLFDDESFGIATAKRNRGELTGPPLSVSYRYFNLSREP